MMKKILLSNLVLASTLLTACGGGSSGDSVTTSDGTTVTSNGGTLTGGVSKLPATVNLTCKSSNTFKGETEDMTMITESGAEGSLEARCNDNDFSVKQGVPSLNIKAAKVVDYWFCTDANNKDALHGFMHTQDLTKGTMQSIWSNGGKAYIKCDYSYKSPLPSTISSDSSIEDLLDYGIDQDPNAQNCTYSTADQNSAVSCSDTGLDRWVIGTNATFTDDNGGVHKLSEKTTWITTKH